MADVELEIIDLATGLSLGKGLRAKAK